MSHTDGADLGQNKRESVLSSIAGVIIHLSLLCPFLSGLMGIDIVCVAENARSTCPQISFTLFTQNCIYSSFNDLLESGAETLPVSSSLCWQFRLAGCQGRPKTSGSHLFSFDITFKGDMRQID